MQVLIFISIVILAISAGPLLLLWSLNTLFPALAIPYAIDTCFSVLILSGIFVAKVKVNK